MEENFFKKKLVIVEDNLTYTKNQLENADIQIQRIKNLFEYDLEIWNKRVEHLQQCEKNDKARIESLKRKIEEGYIYLDQNSNKAYKTFEGIEKARLTTLRDETESNYKKLKTKYEKKLRDKGLVPNYVLEAKIKEVKDKKLGKKTRELIDDIKAKTKVPTPIVDLPPGEENITQTERELLLIKEKAERLAKQQKELEETLKERKNISKEFKQIAEDINGESEEIAWLNSKGVDMMIEFHDETGGNAIWRGVITKGFRDYCKEKNYTIGKIMGG